MHGTKHCNDFEDACSKLEDYVSSLARQIQLQKDVQERLIQSEVYYEHQYGEAKIVANVSKLAGVPQYLIKRLLYLRKMDL